MGVNEDSGMSLSASPMARRAAGPSGVVALASGDAGGTGRPQDGDGGVARGGSTPAPPAVTV
jgi:hypothetical protein